MKMSKFVNENRTNQERRVRYCFLRNSGFSRKQTRIINSFRDSKQIEAILQYGELKKKVYVDSVIGTNTN